MTLIQANIDLNEAKNLFRNLNPLPFFLSQDYSESYDKVCLIDNDLHLESLSLEYQSDNYPTIIIVKGNLIVDKLIWNEETDYGIHLIILGNLRAKNIVVGGQLISVWGDVSVEEILCGSYNHGQMYVSNNITAKVIISDDYSFICDGEFQGLKIGDSFYNGKEKAFLEADFNDYDEIFEENVLSKYNGISFEKLLQKLLNNEKVEMFFSNQSVQNYDFKSLILDFYNSKILSEINRYTFDETQKIDFSKISLKISSFQEGEILYLLNDSETVIKKVGNGNQNINELPRFMQKKAYRILKQAHQSLKSREKMIDDYQDRIRKFLGLMDGLLDEIQIARIKDRFILALENPIGYVEKYKENCIRKSQNSFSDSLFKNAFIESLIQEEIAIVLDDKQELKEAIKQLSQLRHISRYYDSMKISHLKLGRKLFAFASDVLILNDSLPENCIFSIHLIRYENDVIYFLINVQKSIEIDLRKLINDLGFMVFT